MTVYTKESYIFYKADGIQKSYPISFTFHDIKDIVVSCTYNGKKKVVQLGIDYTIDKQGEGYIVTFTKAPIDLTRVCIERNQPQIQTVDLHTNSMLDLAVLEYSLDSLVLMIQEASQKVYKLQEDGALPKVIDYEKIQEYVNNALDSITSKDTAIEEIYKKILLIYEAIKDLPTGEGSTGSDNNGGIGKEELIAHDNNIRAHRNSLVPAGCIAYFATPQPPEGWLILERKGYSRSEYPHLAEVLYCGDENNDSAEYGFYFDNIDDAEGSRSITGNYFMLGPDVRGEFIRSFDAQRGRDINRVLGSIQEQASLAHKHDLSVYSTNLGRGSMKVYTVETGEKTSLASDGSEELRPRNIALLTCIKY